MNCSFQFQCRWTVSDLWVQDALERLDCVKVPSHAQPLVRWKQALKDQNLWPKAFSLFEPQKCGQPPETNIPRWIRATWGLVECKHCKQTMQWLGEVAPDFSSIRWSYLSSVQNPLVGGNTTFFFFSGWSQPTLGNLIDQRNQPV